MSEAVHSWVLDSSSHSSVLLQAKLLAHVLATQFGVSTPLLHSGIAKGRQTLGRLLSSGENLIWHFGGFDPYLVGRRPSPQTIFIYHNITPAHFFWRTRPQVALLSKLGKQQVFSLPKDANWVTVSEYNAFELAQMGFRNVDICPAIVETLAVNGVGKTPEVSLLFVGRIAPNKNTIALLHHARWVADRLAAPVTLTVVGDTKRGCGFGVAFERAAVDLVGHPWLTLDWRRGGVDRTELGTLYARTWLYVSTSLHEGFGLPVCEAISAGTPALYQACGGTESVLAYHGMVSPEQAADFGTYVLELVTAEERRARLLESQLLMVRQYMTPDIDLTIRTVFGSLLGLDR